LRVKKFLSPRNELDKAVIVGRSYNKGVWGPQPPEVNGDSDAEKIFTVFSKKYVFLSVLWS